MITQFKIYERFSNKLLVDSIYEFLTKYFLNSKYTIQKKHTDVDIMTDDDIFFTKTKGGTFYTGRIAVFKQKQSIVLYFIRPKATEISSFLKYELDKNGIIVKYEFSDDQKYSHIKFNVDNYDKVVSIINNLSIDDLSAFLNSKKYNL